MPSSAPSSEAGTGLQKQDVQEFQISLHLPACSLSDAYANLRSIIYKLFPTVMLSNYNTAIQNPPRLNLI